MKRDLVQETADFGGGGVTRTITPLAAWPSRSLAGACSVRFFTSGKIAS